MLFVIMISISNINKVTHITSSIILALYINAENRVRMIIDVRDIVAECHSVGPTYPRSCKLRNS